VELLPLDGVKVRVWNWRCPPPFCEGMPFSKVSRADNTVPGVRAQRNICSLCFVVLIIYVATAAYPRNSHGVAHKRCLPQAVTGIPDLRSSLSDNSSTGFQSSGRLRALRCSSAT